MPVATISVSLNQVTCAGARTRSDQRALLTTNHRTSNRADTGADERSFQSTVMNAAITSMATLSIDT